MVRIFGLLNAELGYAGAAAALVDTVEAFGSGTLSVADVLEPAIHLAEEGYSREPFKGN
jgi:gamma-glutamyltranspeptidase